MNRDWKAVLGEHVSVAQQLQASAAVLDGIVGAVATALRGGRRVFTFGNGGSAADAQHIAAELLGRFKLNRQAWPAMALTTDSSALTAISNDLGYENVFSRQVEGLARQGDVVWALSTSGRSSNVLAGLKAALAAGAVTVGFTGASGEAMAPLCAHLFRAPHTSSDRIQEMHMLAYHYVCERVEAELTRRQPGASRGI